MVLDQECTDIAECLGLNIALNEFPEAGATVDIRATLLPVHYRRVQTA